MTQTASLPVRLQAELDEFLSSIHQEEAVQKLYGSPSFTGFLERYEQLARSTFSSAAANYGIKDVQVDQLPEGPQRDCMRSVIDSTLQQLLELCKQAMRKAVDTFVSLNASTP